MCMASIAIIRNDSDCLACVHDAFRGDDLSIEAQDNLDSSIC